MKHKQPIRLVLFSRERDSHDLIGLQVHYTDNSIFTVGKETKHAHSRLLDFDIKTVEVDKLNESILGDPTRTIRFVSKDRTRVTEFIFGVTDYSNPGKRTEIVPDDFEVIGFSAALGENKETIKWFNLLVAPMPVKH